jgi:glycosyltransferase involved in cell wall biosynthesis
VAIPAYNEEVAIGSVVLRSLKYADEVIVVDDGSKDNTAEVARLAGARVITHEKNGGYGAAIKTCFKIAQEASSDIMVIIDADGQHNPDDIPALVTEMMRSRSDIVIGSRFVNGNGKKQKIPAYRKVGMHVLDTATEIGSGYHITDSQSGFRIYSKNAIHNIDLNNNGMAVGSEILIQAADTKLKITEVPIKVRYDIENTSSENPITHGLSVLSNIIGLISQKRPLLFFCVPGALLILAGAIFGIAALNAFNLTRNISVIYTVGGAIFVMIGMFSIFTGLILSSIQNIRLKD